MLDSFVFLDHNDKIYQTYYLPSAVYWFNYSGFLLGFLGTSENKLLFRFSASARNVTVIQTEY